MQGFSTHVAGIPCRCVVRQHSFGSPPKVYGSAWEDFDPGEPEHLGFEILDRKGYKAPWLAKKISPADAERLEEEAKASMLAERFGIAF